MPLTVPDATVALVTSLLLQVPPVLVSVNIVERPAHTFVVPPIAAGKGFTVIVAMLIQPEGKV